MPWAARGRPGARARSGRPGCPPWIAGWRVFTRPPEHLGRAGHLGHLAVWATPAAARAAAVLPLATQLPAELDQPAGQLHQAGLVVDGQQRPHRGPRRPGHGGRGQVVQAAARRQLVQRPQHGGRVQPPLDRLDPLVQRLDSCRPPRTGTSSRARTGPASISSVARWTVQPVTGTAGGQGVRHRVPAREGRQERRVGVQDAAGEGVVDRLAEHGAEAGHGHQVGAAGREGRRHLGV